MKRQRNSFLTPLVVEVMPSGKTFKVAREFTYLWRQREYALTIHVPVGFITDFASVPRVCRLLIPKLGRYTKAAVVHDYNYRQGLLSRKVADRCFRDSMKDLGVVSWKRWAMWSAVRIGGWMAWRKR